MRKLSVISSEISTPLSQQPSLILGSFSDISIQYYELEGRNDFTCKTKDEQANQFHERLDVKDMFMSPYQHATRVSVLHIILGAAIGVAGGLLLSRYEVARDVTVWVSFPGKLFINSLTCLIMPMVFCSVVACIGELVTAGKAAAIGGRTVLYFVMASLTSSTIGTMFGALFLPFFTSQKHNQLKIIPVTLKMLCPSGVPLQQLVDGGLSCADPDVLGLNASSNASHFNLTDVSNMFVRDRSTFQVLTVTDQVISILFDLIPENIIAAFAGGSTLSVISFALLFGVAVMRSHESGMSSHNHVLLLVTQTSVLFRMLINMVVKYIPIAVISLVAGSVAEYSNSINLLKSVGFLAIALISALATLTFGIMGTVLFVTTRRNIFTYLQHMVPAQVFIFGCSSSIATLPMTMRCVDSTREVSRALSRFVLTVGATSNLNGTAVYMPLACIFMAKVGGYEDSLTPVTFVMLALVGAISSLGVAPVPHSGLVMVITVWKTVFGGSVPPVFSILVGTDWLLNRVRAVVNITNDTIIARIIADQCDETVFMEKEIVFNEPSILETPPTLPATEYRL